ncbi:MAG TPA: cutinase family protein, partial [Methylococcales bacterium]
MLRSVLAKISLVATLFIFLATPLVKAAYTVIDPVEDSNCARVLVVFARGSGQNGDFDSQGNSIYQTNDSDIKNIYTKAGLVGTEKQTAKFFEEFHKRVPTGVQYVSLHDFVGKYNGRGYAATDAEIGFEAKPFYRKDVSSRYYESVKDGAEELAWYLEDQLTSCPLQRVVVGGYSQGAEVIADGINIVQPDFRSRITYMAMYGDPKFNPMQSLLPPKRGSWFRGNTFGYTHGILDKRVNYIPEGIGSAGSWCNIGDIVCDAGALDSSEISNYLLGKLGRTEAHSEAYDQYWIAQSMPEIVKVVRDTVQNVNTNSSVYINKGDKLWNLDLAVVVDTSASMSESLRPIRNNVDTITSDLLASYWNSRVGIVTYDGTPTPDPSHEYSKIMQPFTNNIIDLGINIGGVQAEQPYYGLLPNGGSYMLP